MDKDGEGQKSKDSLSASLQGTKQSRTVQKVMHD